MLCLDYHGMFEQTPDYWGGNNYWPSNPYNVTNGGPCINQNGFFTNSVANKLYQARLRYLVARYGYSPALLAWEFFNEIDNVYTYLQPADVAAWHARMATWLHANDPFGHLVTTSLTGSSDRPEIWSLAGLDFANYHSYLEPSPATRLAEVARSGLLAYGKPMLIGEFGTDWRGWNRSSDPYLRGFRQGLWGGALGGSAGSAMAWYWESIHAENVYPLYKAMDTVLRTTGWGRGNWEKITFSGSGSPPPLVGELLPSGESFNAFLQPKQGWGVKPTGRLAVANSQAAGYASSSLDCFVHGSAHSELRVPFKLSAWLTNEARIVLHLNSVSSGASLMVLVNGQQLYRTNLPNLDGTWSVNNEYNLDIPVNLPAGKKDIEIANAGSDWFYLDWVRLEGVLPSTYSGNWVPLPEAVGLRGEHEALAYAVAPGVSFPISATNSLLPIQRDQKLVFTNWPAGKFIGRWFDPATGKALAQTEGVSSNTVLELPLPAFAEDIAGIIHPPPTLGKVQSSADGGFEFELESETGGIYILEKSSDLRLWRPLATITNAKGSILVTNTPGAAETGAFFRAYKPL
jgi:hypothetical protein